MYIGLHSSGHAVKSLQYFRKRRSIIRIGLDAGSDQGKERLGAPFGNVGSFALGEHRHGTLHGSQALKGTFAAQQLPADNAVRIHVRLFIVGLVGQNSVVTRQASYVRNESWSTTLACTTMTLTRVPSTALYRSFPSCSDRGL